MKVEILSIEKQVFLGEVKFIVVPGKISELGILDGHTPLLTLLKPGTIRIRLLTDTEKLIFVSGGIVEVKLSIVTVLADTAIHGEDLDENKVKNILEKSKEICLNKLSNTEYAIAKAELISAIAQMKIIQHLRRNRV